MLGSVKDGAGGPWAGADREPRWECKGGPRGQGEEGSRKQKRDTSVWGPGELRCWGQLSELSNPNALEARSFPFLSVKSSPLHKLEMATGLQILLLAFNWVVVWINSWNHLPATKSWKQYQVSLGLSFLIFKMGANNNHHPFPASQDNCGNETNYITSEVPDLRQSSSGSHLSPLILHLNGGCTLIALNPGWAE